MVHTEFSGHNVLSLDSKIVLLLTVSGLTLSMIDQKKGRVQGVPNRMAHCGCANARADIKATHVAAMRSTRKPPAFRQAGKQTKGDSHSGRHDDESIVVDLGHYEAILPTKSR